MNDCVLTEKKNSYHALASEIENNHYITDVSIKSKTKTKLFTDFKIAFF